MKRSCHSCAHAMYWREHGVHSTFIDCAKLEDDWHILDSTMFLKAWPMGYEGIPSDGSYANTCSQYEEFTADYRKGDPRYVEPVLPETYESHSNPRI
jgi:hypothetical protein